ncbi:GntR family transcriptional regulator [Jatrophihabitans sp. DSM 45814]
MPSTGAGDIPASVAAAITLEPDGVVPPYEQIRTQYAAKIASRELTVGTRLPTVRQLAAELGLAVNTVARAYRELEVAGLIETRGRAGSVVSAAGDAARSAAVAAADEFVDTATSLGIAPAEAMAMVRASLDRRIGS